MNTKKEIDQFIQDSLVTRHFMTPRVKWLETALHGEKARHAIAEFALAVQAFRRDHGEFPEDPSALVPAYLDALPIDPMDKTGLPLRYRQSTSTRANVWSVGLNGTDESSETYDHSRRDEFKLAKFDFGVFGFSSMETALPAASNSTTPYWSGFDT